MDAATIAALRADFQRDGYLLLKNVLPKEQVARLNRAVDNTLATQPDSLSYNLYNSVERDPEFAALIDEPEILPLVVNLLGFNIQLHISHLTIRRQNPNPAESEGSKSFINWHQDGPHPEFPSPGGVTSLYYVKTCYILSDLSESGRGNTQVIPGSHRRPFRPSSTGAKDTVEGAVEIQGKPGDVFIFGQNLWHAAAPNASAVERRQLFLGYSYLWMRPLDYRTPSAQLLVDAPPIRRQLLGVVDDDPFRNYVPLQTQLPLKSMWLGDSGESVYS